MATPRTVFLTTIDDTTFHDLIADRAQSLLSMARYLVAEQALWKTAMTRPLLGDLTSQAAQLEELLDAYGARNNQRWCQLRALTAALKLFAGVGYKLRHLYHVLPTYRLPRIDQNFTLATHHALQFTSAVLCTTAGHILDQAAQLALSTSTERWIQRFGHLEQLPQGYLPQDRATRQINTASATVTHLASAFLSLAAESELLNRVAQLNPEEYPTSFPDPVSEENLRYLKYRFHNLQSLYDTYVAETVVEHLDADLLVLRGHISVIFHLLEIATELAHYYERHVDSQTGDTALRHRPVVEPDALLKILMTYAITYASLYLVCGKRLCHDMLKRYAEVGQIKVPVPHYRGFHVRPATLVAKIALHYGSEVRMILDDEPYDASSPLDLFRANEKINAQKRRWLASEIAQLTLPQHSVSEAQFKAMVMDVVFGLAEQGKLIIYELPVLLGPAFSPQADLLEQIANAITRLQAIGKIDIKRDLSITFVGDKRVLADIEILAHHGYGEDNFGNNIPLPRALAYLRR